MTISASIPTSTQVAHATNSGEPIISAQPKHAVSQSVMALARNLSGPSATGDAPFAPTAPKSRAAAPKRSLLRRNGR
jgi:septum formation inhibitor-activating ATPase MinD